MKLLCLIIIALSLMMLVSGVLCGILAIVLAEPYADALYGGEANEHSKID